MHRDTIDYVVAVIGWGLCSTALLSLVGDALTVAELSTWGVGQTPMAFPTAVCVLAVGTGFLLSTLRRK